MARKRGALAAYAAHAVVTTTGMLGADGQHWLADAVTINGDRTGEFLAKLVDEVSKQLGQLVQAPYSNSGKARKLVGWMIQVHVEYPDLRQQYVDMKGGEG